MGRDSIICSEPERCFLKTKKTKNHPSPSFKQMSGSAASITICAYGSGSRVSLTTAAIEGTHGEMSVCEVPELQYRRPEHRIEHILGTITAARSLKRSKAHTNYLRLYSSRRADGT